jgi:hypothetical protein
MKMESLLIATRVRGKQHSVAERMKFLPGKFNIAEA